MEPQAHPTRYTNTLTRGLRGGLETEKQHARASHASAAESTLSGMCYGGKSGMKKKTNLRQVRSIRIFLVGVVIVVARAISGSFQVHHGLFLLRLVLHSKREMNP